MDTGTRREHFVAMIFMYTYSGPGAEGFFDIFRAQKFKQKKDLRRKRRFYIGRIRFNHGIPCFNSRIHLFWSRSIDLLKSPPLCSGLWCHCHRVPRTHSAGKVGTSIRAVEANRENTARWCEVPVLKSVRNGAGKQEAEKHRPSNRIRRCAFLIINRQQRVI